MRTPIEALYTEALAKMVALREEKEEASQQLERWTGVMIACRELLEREYGQDGTALPEDPPDPD